MQAYLVEGLGHQTQEIPKHVRILQIGLGIALLRVNKVGKLDRVAEEEDGRVVAHHVPVAYDMSVGFPSRLTLLRVKLDRKPTGIPLSVRCPLLPADGGEAQEAGSPLA